MKPLVVAALVGGLVAAAAPASAQVTYAPEVGPPSVVAPRIVVVPHTRYRVSDRIVLVPRTRYVRRSVLVPRTRYVRRVLEVPVRVYDARRSVATVPVGPYDLATPLSGYAPVYPGTGLIGPTWVPPGTTYACRLGTVGCDSSAVGAMAF